MKFVYHKLLGGRDGAIGILVIAVILLLIMPLALDIFRLNNVGKYLSLAFVAVSLVLCWGYGGILSLGQGIFWGLGGYCMAAFLKLEAARTIANEQGTDQVKALTTVGIPDFMDWNQITELPWFWVPFNSFALTLVLIAAVPALIAFVIGVAMFKRRVTGVYFAIITLALCWAMEILFVTRQGWTGGINGITDLRTLLGWDIRTESAQYIIYFLTVVLLFLCVMIGRLILGSKYGRLLIALRDAEDRVRFSGYDVANLKIFIFCLAGVMSAIGGAMFVMNVGFMSPKLLTIEPSIYMVIFCAVGGRLSLLGAIYGTLAVSFARTYFSEQFPSLWYFLIGGVFISVTLFFPLGLAGVYDSHLKPWLLRLFAMIKTKTAAPSPASGSSKESQNMPAQSP